ncbi:hypothetical protein B0H13DRAFT_1907670 [Mycena leptocephala]|nr:hypothetical protein B0H13DRAFT_1907670 [Mycena leptocephala]
MPSISEPSLSIVALPLPGSTKVVVLVLGVIVAAAIIYYASPMRLTRVLVATIAATEKSYLEAIETGLLYPYDVDTAEMLSSLQLKVSNIREATLIDSRSNWKALRGFLKGRALTILRCIWEVRDLEAHIEVINSGPFSLFRHLQVEQAWRVVLQRSLYEIKSGKSPAVVHKSAGKLNPTSAGYMFGQTPLPTVHLIYKCCIALYRAAALTGCKFNSRFVKGNLPSLHTLPSRDGRALIDSSDGL